MNTAITVEKFNQRTVAMSSSMALSILAAATAALFYAGLQPHKDLLNAIALGCAVYNGISYFLLKYMGESGKSLADNAFARIGALVNIVLVIGVYLVLGDAGVCGYTVISMAGQTVYLLYRLFNRNNESFALVEEAALEFVRLRK